MSIKIVKSKDVLSRMQQYRGYVVYGVPQESALRDPKKAAQRYDNKNLEHKTYNNAEILALMENGSMLNNLPERKLLRPVFEKHKEQIKKDLLAINHDIILGLTDDADYKMERLALRVEMWTKKFFTDPDNSWAPNAPITINGGWMRNKKSGKPVYIKGKHSDKPLIDTGELRKSIRGLFRK